MASSDKSRVYKPNIRQHLASLARDVKTAGTLALQTRFKEDGTPRMRVYRLASEADSLIDYVNSSEFVGTLIQDKYEKLSAFKLSLENNLRLIELSSFKFQITRKKNKQGNLIDYTKRLIDAIGKHNEDLIALMHFTEILDPDAIPSIPTEVPAPIRIAVTEDRISLTAPKHKSGQIADKSIENFRRSACEILDELIEELSLPTSNADRRLNPRLKSLRKELGVPLPDMAVEAVGLQWQVTSDVIAATHETVPDALLPQIQRILSTIRNLLAQFDEWHEYEAITIAETISPENTLEIAQIGDEIATDIDAKSEIIDSQIGDRLHDMAVALSNGLVKRETIANPVIGSLNNLFAGIAQFVLERGSFIINPAVDVFIAVTDPTTLGRGVALLGFCTFVMNKFAPRLMEYAPFSWLKTILPTSLKYYSALSKSGKG